jgi:DNA-binding SARP family transcriptional activator
MFAPQRDSGRARPWQIRLNGVTNADVAQFLWMERVRIALFGGPKAIGDGFVAARFPTTRSAILLARLALAPGKRMTRDALAESLWPDDFLDASRTRVRKELARLREALGGHERVLVADRQFVGLDESAVEVDVDLLRSLLRSAALANTPLEACDRFERARSLAGEPPLPAGGDDWCEVVRQELNALRARAAVEHARALVATGRPREAVAAAQEATTLLPLDESASQVLREALRGSGLAGEAGEESARLRRARDREGLPTVEVEEATPVTLPVAAPRSLIGREFELGYVTDLLSPHRDDSCRLVTLAGPAGSGKTSLAQEATRVLAPLFPGGAFFLRLEDEGDPATVELPEGEQCLIVLDNGEQLLPGLADRVREVLTGRPTVWLLVTSIVPLGIGEETVVRLFPLPVPREHGDPLAFPSVGLFLEVARRTGHPLPSDAETLAAVADIVRALEGWPLAVVLAAGRVGVLPPVEMAARLGDLPQLLKSRRHDLPERHRSLEAAVGWSLRLLPDETKAALVRLAGLDPPFGLVQAERALDGEADALDALERLVEWGAVERVAGAGGLAFRVPSPIRRFVAAWDGSGTVAR